MEERHEEARQHRRVWVEPQPDGMADLIAHLPAVEAMGIYDRMTRIAKRIERATDPQEASAARTRDQIRADVLAHLAIQGVPPSYRGSGASGAAHTDIDVSADSVYTGMNRVAAQVQIVIPVTALGPEVTTALAHARPPGTASPGTAPPGAAPPGAFSPEDPPHPEPAFLSAYGPIDDTSARRLASKADHWETVRVDYASGIILSVDRYRPTEAMRRHLAARDQHCRFPGCTVQAVRCDIDHTIDAALGGATVTSNLAHLCRAHHTLKHHSDWRVTQGNHGVLQWTSPTGRTKLDRPPRQTTSTRQQAQNAPPRGPAPPKYNSTHPF
jgi:hypothetical protein